jgi:hypothetical protein
MARPWFAAAALAPDTTPESAPAEAGAYTVTASAAQQGQLPAVQIAVVWPRHALTLSQLCASNMLEMSYFSS